MKPKSLKIGQIVCLVDEPIKGTIIKIKNDLITIATLNEGLELTYPQKNLIKIEENNSHIKSLYCKFTPMPSYDKSLKSNFYHKSKKTPLNKEKNLLEIDLHAEKIIKEENWPLLQKGQIIGRQLALAKEAIEKFSLDKNYKKLILIHGKGKSILKNEIGLLIKKNYPHLDFSDASYEKYGISGATEIFFKSKISSY